MIEDERVAAYIDSLNTGNEGFLAELQRSAVEEGIPIIRPQVQSLLRTVIAGLNPRLILEVGTAVGFSAILMAECAPEDCRITTIENYEKRIPAAKENFVRSGYSDRITLIEGDAADVLNMLVENLSIMCHPENSTCYPENNTCHPEGTNCHPERSRGILNNTAAYDKANGLYDLIFMDAAKGQYLNFFDNVMRLLRKGGILVSDNVLQDGDIIQSRFAVRRRDRTIHSRMRDYLYALTHDDRLSTVILPMGDGVTVSVRI